MYVADCDMLYVLSITVPELALNWLHASAFVESTRQSGWPAWCTGTKRCLPFFTCGEFGDHRSGCWICWISPFAFTEMNGSSDQNFLRAFLLHRKVPSGLASDGGVVKRYISFRASMIP